MVIASITAFSKLKPYCLISNTSFWFIIIDCMSSPSMLRWQSIVKSGVMFQTLVTFYIWTFNILYGMDLRASLISQNFEMEVNEWGDFNYFDSHIALLFDNSHRAVTNNNVPDKLHFDIFSMDYRWNEWARKRSRKLTNVFSSQNLRLLSKYMENAQNNPMPSNLVFITTE